ncbi:MAG: M24 family metallopeptidase, partial [Phycisphaerae bacterium]|nr:M24 family metallopeptidase [Phycisphaerae bacterium]
MHSLTDVQRYLAEQGIDAWLLYDFRGSNPVFARLCPQKKWTTRRVWLHIPAAGRGEPVLLHSGIDGPSFREVNLPKRAYLGWRDMTEALSGLLGPGARIAMDYSPGNALPVVSCVDAGAVELVRGLGAEVVSSADVAQVAVAAWSSAALEAHGRASCAVAGIKDGAFDLIRQRVRAGQRVLEHEVAEFIREGFKREGLQWPDGPIVAVNAHSGDPHYEPGADRPTEITRGDWVLIDLWARRPGDENIFSDITWCGFVGDKARCPADRLNVFQTVRAARDAALEAARTGWKRPGGVQG